MVATAQWYDVDLETLRLRAVDLPGWPAGIGYRTRMKEECLESVVAFNLDLLFPHEDLLLIGADFLPWRSGDVVAMDPFGCIRLMELKKAPTELQELGDQVVSYGINRDRLPSWEVRMARVLTRLPERVDLRLLGFKANQRTENLGKKYIERHNPSLLNGSWDHKDRFERAHLLADALRASLDIPSSSVVPQNTAVDTVVTRLYDMPLTDIPLDDPDEAVRKIAAKRCGERPSLQGTEFTLIAPDLARRVGAGIPYEERGARFYLIDAELRHRAGRRGVRRAILRWEPVHRTTTTYHVRTAAALRRLLRPEVAALQCTPSYRSFYWHDFKHMYLWVREVNRSEWIIETRFDSLTEGLADLKSKWRGGMRKLRQNLSDSDARIRRKGRYKLSAPWDLDDLEPAATLVSAYYAMLRQEGFFDLDPYRWYTRSGMPARSRSELS